MRENRSYIRNLTTKRMSKADLDMIQMARFCKVTSRRRKRENGKEVERKKRQPG